MLFGKVLNDELRPDRGGWEESFCASEGRLQLKVRVWVPVPAADAVGTASEEASKEALRRDEGRGWELVLSDVAGRASGLAAGDVSPYEMPKLWLLVGEPRRDDRGRRLNSPPLVRDAPPVADGM